MLHLKSFLEDLDLAWAEFVRRVEEDDVFRERVLERTREAPLLTVLSDDAGNASVADSFVATHFGTSAAEAASGSPGRGWSSTARPPFQFEPTSPQPPKMDIPKGRPTRKKK